MTTPETTVGDGTTRCRCGAALPPGTGDRHCAACAALNHRFLLEPPEVPAFFWEHPVMRVALADWHMGRVVRAFRTHPHHRRPVSQETAAAWFGVTQGQLSRVETGPPVVHLDRLTHWARTLRVPPHLLWFATGLPPRSHPVQDGVTSSQTTEGEPWAGQGLAAVHGQPRVGDELVEGLRAVTAVYRRMYHTVPATELFDAVARHTRSTSRLTRDARGRHGRALSAVTGEAALLTGRLALFDLGQPWAARACFRLAAHAARQADDHALEAVVLGTASFVPRDAGRPGDALDTLTAARRVARDHHTVSSWIAALESMTLARLNRQTESLAAAAQARNLLDEPAQHQHPEWFDYYDQARLAGFEALAQLTLGRAEPARATLDVALGALDPGAAKQRACFLADKATAYALQEEVEAACTLATQALDLLDEVRYATGLQRVHDLLDVLEPHRAHPAVADLGDRLLVTT